jgi:formylglycine-generating enzyme required for sulfatase activity/uncharacterized caspase-like protein
MNIDLDRVVAGLGRILHVLVFTLACMAPANVFAAPKRIALIIANSDYMRGLPKPAPDPCPNSDENHLCNVEIDAHLVERALVAAGFQENDITLERNLRRDDIRSVLDQFKSRAKGAEVALIYLAGHGLFSKFDNWFVPVPTRGPLETMSESDIPTEAFNLDAFVSVTAGAKWRIVAMDACRNNPFSSALDRPTALKRQKTAMRYQHDKLDNNVLLIYSTVLGQAAPDGPDDQSSDFARGFAQRISEPNLPLQLIGKKITTDMARASRPGQVPQVPAIVDTLPAGRTFSLIKADIQVSAGASLGEDEDDWRSSYAAYEKTADVSLLAPYLTRHPTGVFASKARLLIGPPRGPGGLAPSAGSVFRDCDKSCPEMVVLPAGAFQMTSSETGPMNSHASSPPAQTAVEVRFASPFAVSRFAITFDEWDACFADGGCGNSLKDDGWGRGNFPVIHASWEDAQAYVGWLAGKTGKPYRLLSEAEYDYANRAGTTSTFWWGDQVGSAHANCKGCGEISSDGSHLALGEQTLAVGSFAANPFGLFDTEGNVVSWTFDCWNDTIAGQSQDGRASQGGDCTQRVLRGGSWRSAPKLLESSYRGRYFAKENLNITGFRVARDLP